MGHHSHLRHAEKLPTMPIDQTALKALLGKAGGNQGKNRGNRWGNNNNNGNNGQRQRSNSEGDFTMIAGEKRVELLEKLVLMCVFCPAELNPLQMLDEAKYDKLPQLAPRLWTRASRTKVLEQLSPKLKLAFKQTEEETTPAALMTSAMMKQMETISAFHESIVAVFNKASNPEPTPQGVNRMNDLTPFKPPPTMIPVIVEQQPKANDATMAEEIIENHDMIKDIIPDDK